MKFSLQRPVKIVMLGAGGTGGHIAPPLYRLLYSLDRPVRFIICDGDVVEEKNLVRQNFTPADLGENKAKVLAERYSSVFGLETEYVPSFVESEEQLRKLLFPLFSPQTTPRRHVHKQAEELVYIDSGNGEYTGQVVCGVRRSGRTYYPPIGAAYPDVLEETDKFPTELSCAEASVSAPQSMAANITAATAVVDMVYSILATGKSAVRQVTFSTQTVNVRPELQKARKAA